MKTKQKAAEATQTEYRREADKFLWHMRPPWLDKFDHDHWWNKPSGQQVAIEAVIWEALRRHPRVIKLLEVESLPLLSSGVDTFIATFGTISWPELLRKGCDGDWRLRLWEMTPQNGFCPKGSADLSHAVTAIGARGEWETAEMRSLVEKYWDSITGEANEKVAFDKMRQAKKIWNDSCPPTGGHGVGLSEEAFRCLSRGDVLIGFNPNFPGVEKLVQMQVRQILAARKSRGASRKTLSRSYWQETLDIIGKFERTELARKKSQVRDDQMFARYRRAILKWRW